MLCLSAAASGTERSPTRHGTDENYHRVWVASWRRYWLRRLRNSLQGTVEMCAVPFNSETVCGEWQKSPCFVTRCATGQHSNVAFFVPPCGYGGV